MAERKNSEKRIATNNRWTNAHYDRINIAVPKGRKDEIKALADARGQSVNAYIVSALDEKVERDGAGTPTTGADGILTRSTVKAAQKAAQAAGEDLSQFVARAVEAQAHRDALARKMDINPTAGGKLETEA